RAQVFAERGREAQNPGPMIRVRAGTIIRLSVHNTIRDSTLVVYGLHTRPSGMDDTVHVAPDATRQLVFAAGAPGTYFYWATTTHHPVADRADIDAQLHGAFIVDPAEGTPPADRVFVLGSYSVPVDKQPGFNPALRLFTAASSPHPQRLTYPAADTAR